MSEQEKLAQQYREIYGENAKDVAERDFAEGSLTWHEVLELL